MLQVLEMTQDEKYKMYSKLRKKELINMLIEANNVIHRLTMQPIAQIKPYYIPQGNDDLVLYGELCSCNPKNGGSGICGCVMGNKMVKRTHNQLNSFNV
jgi:hypothetical protein